MEEFYDEVELKKTINNFLWVNLSGNTTLKEAEDLAIKIFNMILETQPGEEQWYL